jgi:hypothetical protein
LPGWSYRSFTRPENVKFTYRYQAGAIADSSPFMVIDRLHLSGYAYGMQFGGESQFTEHHFKMIELMLLKHQATVIYMKDSEKNIRSRWGTDEMFGSDCIHDLSGHFEDILKKTKLPVIRCNLKDFIDAKGEINDGKVIEFIEDMALVERAWSANSLPPPSIGCGKIGSILYIGESASDSFVSKSYEPQCPFSGGPASMFFWEALEKAEVPWEEGFYTNADEFPSDAHVWSLISQCKPKAIVCLGEKAKKLMEWNTAGSCEIMQLEVRHPMFAKRFFGKNKNALEKYSQCFAPLKQVLSQSVV